MCVCVRACVRVFGGEGERRRKPDALSVICSMSFIIRSASAASLSFVTRSNVAAALVWVMVEARYRKRLRTMRRAARRRDSDSPSTFITYSLKVEPLVICVLRDINIHETDTHIGLSSTLLRFNDYCKRTV